MPGREFIDEALESLGISDAHSLAVWGKRKGLLGIYIVFRAHTTFLPGAWQVVRPGEKTDPKALAVNRGCKTFTFSTVAEKHVAEKAARAWTDYHYANDGWRRIERFGTTLFPKSLADELTLYIPDLLTYETHSKSKSTKRR